jgi:FkbM family methyltransferase
MDKHGELVDGRGTYQIKKLRASMEVIDRRDVAVDVGAHVGLWAMHLARRFARVLAFEPVAAFRECFGANVAADNVELHPVALGSASGSVEMSIDPADTGGTHVGKAIGGTVEMRTLDSYALPVCDYLKIDCEGYELQVLEGGIDTIARCRPVIVVEQKPHKLGVNYGITGTPAVDLLKAMKYFVHREMGGDYIMIPGCVQ